MATFAQNIAKIRGEAIKGTDMRTAIADAMEQANANVGANVTPLINQFKQDIDGKVQTCVEQVSALTNQYKRDVQDALDQYLQDVEAATGGQADVLQRIVNSYKQSERGAIDNYTASIMTAISNYTRSITGTVSSFEARFAQMEEIVGQREIYVTTTQIEGDDYRATITG